MPKKTNLILKVLLSVYLCLMSYYLYTHQYYNVDIEAYMGLLYKAEYPEMKIEEIHQKVFAELDEKRPGMFESDLSHEETAKGENTYYKTISENPKVFEEELQLFSVKPFYNFVNLLFFKAGFAASTSTFLISILSYALILYFIFLFLSKILKNHQLAFLLTILLSLFKPLLESSRHASPDSLSCLLLLLSFYVFIIKRNFHLATVLAMLCILTRPEYFIFYSFIYILIFIQRKKIEIKSHEFAISFVYLFLSFAIVQYFNQISWSTLFMNQFTKVQLYPISNPDAFNFQDYLHFIKSKILFEFNSSYFLLLLIFIIIIVYNKFSFQKKNGVPYLFFGFVYLSIFLRFLIFPTMVNRMMIGYYLIIILGLIYIQSSKEDLCKKLS
ncbi:glycosyltransferase family 39 protein [Chryseobacterium sp. Ch-15]|uniref:Glycosyltransferase family 39 protein n=1 Tax=Chryseobacterium muglaense TaxID=2893752 RepID=A0A9Q3UU62_9FLAO|nr:glycosyltransferase family 39 protein [Chryseobacterium muglaense]MBD3905110.1 glycosyltransferase family 39 protein [Chryseobacterium muglaense]MCC9033449.1 glycosyltransferase family 39 protein [Chryseobacterium muglaense]MCM2554968.1 glycosyltransferase family 39 protein [Chryseobacterium muglaense]